MVDKRIPNAQFDSSTNFVFIKLPFTQMNSHQSPVTSITQFFVQTLYIIRCT